MKAVLSNRIYLESDLNLRFVINEELTYIIPPRFQGDFPEVIRNMSVVNDRVISLPIGRTDLIPDGYEIKDNRVYVPVTFPERKLTLRKSQQDVYDLVSDNYLLNAKVGWGKTFTGLAIAGKLSQKTLVVVHNQVLRDQWVEETQNMYGFTPDIIGGGKFGTSTPIVIGNIQSLSKNPTKVQNLFGTLIVDEVHHAPASTFSTLIDNNRARYKIGLSGTLERKDEKHVVIKDYFSKSVISPPAENTEKPEVHVIESDIPFPINVSSWAQANNILCNNPNYIELIVFLADYYAEQGHKVLVVGNRVEFLKQCSEYFNPEEVALCIGETPTEIKNNLKVVMETKKILFASQQLFSEGMSVNSLSCLIMAAPLNNQPLLEQLIGRVIRKSDNKKSPVVVDIKLQGGTTYNQYNKRLGHYIDQSYKISYFRKNSL